MYGYIYKTTNLINGKIYIGQHKSESFDADYKGSGKYLRRSINKYGIDKFSVEIIDIAQDKSTLNLLEKNGYDFIENAVVQCITLQMVEREVMYLVGYLMKINGGEMIS